MKSNHTIPHQRIIILALLGCLAGTGLCSFPSIVLSAELVPLSVRRMFEDKFNKGWDEGTDEEKESIFEDLQKAQRNEEKEELRLQRAEEREKRNKERAKRNKQRELERELRAEEKAKQAKIRRRQKQMSELQKKMSRMTKQ